MMTIEKKANGKGNGKEDATPKRKLRLTPSTPRPGALHGETTIDFHTVQGTYLYYGLNETKESASDGKNKRIMGLKRFNEILTRIWVNAPTDPWALWYLVRLEAAIDRSQAQVERMLKKYKDQLNNWKITFRKSSSKEPVQIQVDFVAPLGYRAANLVVTADEAIRLILQAHHVGMIDDALARQELHAVGKSVRRAFEKASTYRYFKVSYKGLKERDAIALEAIEKMGEVPHEILSGKKLPRHVPKLSLMTKKPITQEYWLETAINEFKLDESEKGDTKKVGKP